MGNAICRTPGVIQLFAIVNYFYYTKDGNLNLAIRKALIAIIGEKYEL